MPPELTPRVWAVLAAICSWATPEATLPMVMAAVVARALFAAMRRTPSRRSVVPVQALVPARVRIPLPSLRMTLPVTPPAAKEPEKVVEVLLPPMTKVLAVVPLFRTVPDPASEPMVEVRLVVVSKISNEPLAPMVTGLEALLTLMLAAPRRVPALMKRGPVKVELAPMMSVPRPVLV